MDDETPVVYSNSILRFAAMYGQTATHYAAKLPDSSAFGALGSILEEANDRQITWNRFTSDAPGELVYQLGQLVGDWQGNMSSTKHTEIVQQFEGLAALSASERLAIKGAAKLENPLMIDIGAGNIQSYTAIRLLRDYQLKNASDILDLDQYFNRYDYLIRDLLDPLSPTAMKISLLMSQEALAWGASVYDNWTDISVSQKDAYSVFYYNIGQDNAQLRYSEAVSLGGLI